MQAAPIILEIYVCNELNISKLYFYIFIIAHIRSLFANPVTYQFLNNSVDTT